MLEKNQTKRLLLIYGLVLLVLPVGCQDKTDESEVENAASGLSTGETEVSAGATAGGLQIEEAVTLWARGQKDPAAEILLAVDWNQPIGFSPDAKVFILTEKQLVAMSQMDRANLVQELMDETTRLRALSRHLVASGKAAASQQEYETAEKHLMTVYHFGRIITGDSGSVATVRLVGFVVTKAGLNELTAFYSQTKDQERLLWAQQEQQQVDAAHQQFKNSLIRR